VKTLPLFLLLFIVPVTANAMDEETNVETQVVVRTSPTTELDALCGGNNAKVDAGSVGAAFPSYPCETVRTDLALERLEGREGFKAGSTRFFLNARLFMRGISSVLFGLIGLG
jgi:hypothetical protein